MNARPIIVLTTRYYRSASQKYLSNTLVDEIRLSGREVHVLSIGNVDHEGRVPIGNGSDIFMPFTSRIKYWKFIKLWTLSTRIARKLSKELNHDFDLLTFAPLSALLPVVTVLQPNSRKSVCIIFDIFPEHQRQLKYISNSFAIICKKLETHLLKSHNSVTAMSPMNRSTIESYYGLAGNDVHVLNLWVNEFKKNNISTNDEILRTGSNNSQELNPSGMIKLIFGGQLVAGRKFPVMLDFLKTIRERGVDLELSVYSSGDVYQSLKLAYESEKWIKWLAKVNRDEFRERVAESDFGLAITDDQVNLPTMPSKIFECISAGTRVFCIVESASDVEKVIADDLLLCVNHFSFEEKDLSKAELFFQSIESTQSDLSFHRFYSKFNTKKAWRKIQGIFYNESSNN